MDRRTRHHTRSHQLLLVARPALPPTTIGCVEPLIALLALVRPICVVAWPSRESHRPVGDRRVSGIQPHPVFSAVAAANPARDCVLFGDRRFTFAQTNKRARRCARALHSWGLGAHRERCELGAHESGQSHLGLLAGRIGALPATYSRPRCYVIWRYVNSVGVPALGAQPRNRVSAPATDADNAQRLGTSPSVLRLPTQIPPYVFPRDDGGVSIWWFLCPPHARRSWGALRYARAMA